MPTYIILLRGVNVGKAKRLPMSDLKKVLLEVGCTQVATLLNSGNAVVEHSNITPQALAKKVASAIVNRFDFDVPVVAMTPSEFNRVVSGNTLVVPKEDHSRLLVVFGHSRQNLESLQVLKGLLFPSEELLLLEHSAFLYCADGILESKAARALLGRVGALVTTRNWATVLKLQALANPCLTSIPLRQK